MHRPSRRSTFAIGLGAATVLAATATAAPGDLTRVSLTDAGVQSPTTSEVTAVSATGRYVAFVNAGDLTAALTGAKKQVYVRDRQTGRTLLASSNATGQAANADVDAGDSFNPFIDISGNGRYVVFASTATNLVAADTNGAKADVFRKDLVTGQVVVVSLSSTGIAADESVLGDPSISYDGTRIAFTTGTAKNLFAGDNSIDSDVVMRDLSAGTTVLISQSTAGVFANSFTERPSVSADGNSVAFEAGGMADNLFPNDANAVNDIVVRNVAAAMTAGVSVTAAGAGASGNIPDISADGRYVVFQTGAQLDPVADINAANDIYRRDVVAGVSTVVSAKNGVADARGTGSQAAISADGARVVFASTATDLTAADANGAVQDVYARDVATKVTARASAAADGSQGLVDSQTGTIAGNGGLVAFDTASVFGTDTNALADIYAKELAATDMTAPPLSETLTLEGGVVRVSGTAGPDPSGIGALSVNGVLIRPAAGGAFSTTVPLVTTGATPVSVVAVDGAGNSAIDTRAFIAPSVPTTPPVVAPPIGTVATPRAIGLTSKKVGRRLVVRFTLTAPGTVRVTVSRRVVVKKRARFVRVGSIVTRSLPAGGAVVRIPIGPKKKQSRSYRVRIAVTGPLTPVPLPAVPVS
jgi:Tol biopolymer transport system component